MTRYPSDPTINATVMASAGTGKTWQLVTRLVRLLFAGVKPDAILAITFTRKAAAEMQTRLSERLLTLAAADDTALRAELTAMGIDDDNAPTRARRLYEELLQAERPLRTTTFHAFCQEILRRFPLEADVPPGFELVEKTGELRTAAWDALVGGATVKPDDALAGDLQLLLQQLGSQANLQTALDSFLEHRSDWWAFTADTQDPSGHANTVLQQLLQIEPDSDPLQSLFNDETLQLAVEFRDLLKLHNTTKNEHHVALFALILDETAETTARHEALREVFLTKKGDPLQRKESKVQEKAMKAEGQQRFLQLHTRFCEQLAHVQGQLAALATWHTNGAWYRCGEQLLTHYQRIKEERRLLDFTDLEWRAYQLLTVGDNAHWVQFKLDQRIDHLLVDEFQDTNPTQWRLLLPLLQEMAAGNSERQRSVFLVGDGKQSIYRFRRAEPRLFHVAHDWLQQHLHAEAFPLHVSRRSAPAVMHCVNAVFGDDGPLAGILDGFSQHDTHHRELWGRVELLPLIEPFPAEEAPPRVTLRHPLREPRVLQFDDRYLREGEAIAAHINALLADGTIVGNGATARPLHYGDVLILIRNRNHVADYEQALRAAGIPYIGADRGTLLESLEVDDMVCLLQTLITPYNNLALAQVLRSPLFDSSDEQLSRLAACSDRGTWFERLSLAAADQPAGSPLQRAAACLRRWHQSAGSIPIHDLLDRVYSEGNVMARYEAAFPVHLRPRVRANLTRFIELALEIDHGRYPSLTGFLARLGELREQNEAPDEAPASGGERVRLMTIHASKGLEAAVVFLADAAAAAGNDRPYHTQVGWPAEQARPDFLLLTGRKAQQDPFTQAHLAQEREAAQRESANLLYVALTRARQLLYISGCRPGRGDDLGWYGVLQQALSSATDGNTLENGNPEPLPNVPPPTPTTAVPPVPAQLNSVLPIRRQRREIAPSRQGDIHATGHVDDDGRLRGIAIHRMLQLTDQNRDTTAIQQQVAAELQLPFGDTELAQWWQETLAVREAPQLRDLFDATSYQQAWSEAPIQYDQDGCTVYGIIDRLVLREDEAIIVDYKTHRQAADGALEPLIEAYRPQLRHYADGVRRLWPERTIRALLLFTAIPAVVDVSLD